MKKVVLIFLVVLMTGQSSMISYAQDQGGIPDPNAPVSPAKTKAIRQLLELMGSAKLGQQMMDQFFPLIRQSAKQVPESVWQEIEKEFSTDISTGKFIDRIIPAYSRHFSEEEIAELIKFYESPIGKKMASVLPQLASESMQIGMQWASEVMKRIQQRLKEKGYTMTTD
jgi:uncharacterized protein